MNTHEQAIEATSLDHKYFGRANRGKPGDHMTLAPAEPVCIYCPPRGAVCTRCGWLVSLCSCPTPQKSRESERT